MNAIDRNRNVLTRVLDGLKRQLKDHESSRQYHNEHNANVRVRVMLAQDIAVVEEEIAALEDVLKKRAHCWHCHRDVDHIIIGDHVAAGMCGDCAAEAQGAVA